MLVFTCGFNSGANHKKRHKTFGRIFLTYPHISLSMNTKETNNVIEKNLIFKDFIISHLQYTKQTKIQMFQTIFSDVFALYQHRISF